MHGEAPVHGGISDYSLVLNPIFLTEAYKFSGSRAVIVIYNEIDFIESYTPIYFHPQRSITAQRNYQGDI